MAADIATKTCTMCRNVKPVSLFRSRGGAQSHLIKSICNTCLYKEHRRWVEDNPKRMKYYRLKDKWTIAKRCAKYGITPETLFSVYERQKRCCAICNIEIILSDSAIDHNHQTGEFRGILCKQCNRALGMFRDSVQILENAAEYLRDLGSYGDEP